MLRISISIPDDINEHGRIPIENFETKIIEVILASKCKIEALKRGFALLKVCSEFVIVLAAKISLILPKTKMSEKFYVMTVRTFQATIKERING